MTHTDTGRGEWKINGCSGDGLGGTAWCSTVKKSDLGSVSSALSVPSPTIS